MNPRIPCVLSRSGLAIRTLPPDPAEREAARQLLEEIREPLDFFNYFAQGLQRTAIVDRDGNAVPGWYPIQGWRTPAVPPSPIVHELPSWLLDRLHAAYPDFADAESFEVIVGDPPVSETVSAERVRAHQCEQVLYAELHYGEIELLDHWGRLHVDGDPRGELLILEPHQLTAAGVSTLMGFCKKFRLSFKVSGKSSWDPNDTLRIEIFSEVANNGNGEV